MLSLLRTQTKQLKWSAKRKKLVVTAVRKRMRGARSPGFKEILVLTVLTIDFLHFEVHFSCSVWVLTGDGIREHVWYGLRTNLS